MNTAAVYVRYSSDNQREESIDAQVRAIQDYASRNDIQVIKVYADEARSATTDDRPQFLQMIKDSELGLFNYVIVHKLDRFARNRYDSAFYKRILKRNGVRLLSVLEQLDDSPESIILESVLEGMAEYYSKNLAREVMKGLRENALQAKHTGGPPPLGFSLDPNKLHIINETEAVIIKTIFEMFDSGHGYNTISNTLNEKGLRTRSGKKFTKGTIHDILRNEKYCGTFVYNKRAGKNDNGSYNNHKFKDASEIIKLENAIPAIVSREVFDRVQARMNDRANGPRQRKRYYLLTGLITCGCCESAYVGNGIIRGGNGHEYIIYSCTSRKNKKDCINKNIRQDILEKLVIDEVLQRVFSKKAINEICTKMMKSVKELQKDYNNEVVYFEEKLAETTTKIDRLINAVLDGVIDKDMAKDRNDSLKLEKQQIELRLAELNAQNYDFVDKDKLYQYILSYRENLLSDDPLLKRKTVETFVENIKVYPDRINLILKIKVSDSMVEIRGIEPLTS